MRSDCWTCKASGHDPLPPTRGRSDLPIHTGVDCDYLTGSDAVSELVAREPRLEELRGREHAVLDAGGLR
jgi:hypothetical protein